MAAHPESIWHDNDGCHIDVRGLAPPEPMVAILQLIETIADDRAVIVHHDRNPVYLYPELQERGWVCEIIEGEVGEIRLRLSRRS